MRSRQHCAALVLFGLALAGVIPMRSPRAATKAEPSVSPQQLIDERQVAKRDMLHIARGLRCVGGRCAKPCWPLRCLVHHSADAHGIAGNRFFVGTLTFDDPSVADEAVSRIFPPLINRSKGGAPLITASIGHSRVC
jgi:hypothetical protein